MVPHKLNIDLAYVLVTSKHNARHTCCPNDTPSNCSDTTSSTFPVLAGNVPAPTPVCANADGINGIEDSDGTACCVAECGQCGGTDCSTVGESLDLGADDCCSSEIVDSGDACSDVGVAPCFIDDGKINDRMT